MYNMMLIVIENNVVAMGGNVLSIYGFPQTLRSGNDALHTEVLRETSNAINALCTNVDKN